MQRYLLRAVAIIWLIASLTPRVEAGFIEDLIDDLLNSLGGPVEMEVLWTHQTNIIGEGAAEIVTYDVPSGKVFVTNASAEWVDVVDVRTGANLGQLHPGGLPNSAAAHNGLLAVAIEGGTPQDVGAVVFYNTATLAEVGRVTAGALPDMCTFSPDGQYVVVANEGEPSSDYTVDPEGSVTVIEVKRKKNGYSFSARHARFTAFNSQRDALRASGVRIYGPNASVAQDLEPEYIAVDADSRTAFVSCQENNAIAVVDLRSASVCNVQSLGFKDHSLAGNALDASNQDGAINITNWPVFGMYQPDALACIERYGRQFVLTANEGDAREYAALTEAARVRSLTLDGTAFPNAATLRDNTRLGRLNVTNQLGDVDHDGDFDQLYAFGARSFSVLQVGGSNQLTQVFDSGDQFERITAAELPSDFNSTNDANGSFDNRSDDKGPEPEAITIGSVLGGKYAFIGLERIGGIMVYSVQNPAAPQFELYLNNRDFSASDISAAGDSGPEGLVFIPPIASRSLYPVLIVSNEISGTTTAIRLKRGLDL